MLASAPVTASIAVTSFETTFSAERFSSTLPVLSTWSLLRHAARASAATATRIKVRIRPCSGQKKGLPANTDNPLIRQHLHEWRRRNYIALLAAALALLAALFAVSAAALAVSAAFTAFMSVAFMAFMSVAFMSVVVAFMSVVVRFSSTFMVLLALSLLLQAATARAAPATRIRARIQNSLIIAICSGIPRRKSRAQ